ncbi:unnamed protein product, partial [Owenia fusiformis]
RADNIIKMSQTKKRPSTGPQANKNWKHHRGPISHEYEPEPRKRAQAKKDRLTGLIKRADQLCTKTRGSIFLRYVDEAGNAFVYSQDEDTFVKYQEEGIHPEVGGDERRYNNKGAATHILSEKTKKAIVQEQEKKEDQESIMSPEVPRQSAAVLMEAETYASLKEAGLAVETLPP